jgi:hypothetical protein
VAIVGRVDEGLPIAYEVLDENVPVFSADRQEVGTVDHVVAAPAVDIFHGIVMRTGAGRRFVAADQIAELHERGVDLLIDAAAVEELPEPHGAATAWQVHEPGAKPSRWQHLLHMVTWSDRRRENWTEEE